MAKYRKRPVVVEAFQVTEEIVWKWLLQQEKYPVGLKLAQANYNPQAKIITLFRGSVSTLEGLMSFRIGDWIITGIKGEKYPCKPDIFEQTYEKVEE